MAIAILVAVSVTVDLLAAATGSTEVPWSSTIAQTTLTATFLLFAWRPPTAALVMQVSALVAVLSGAGAESVLPVALGAGLVMATCSRALTVAYLIVFGALVMLGPAFDPGPFDLGTVMALLLVATMSTLVGLFLRRMLQRTIQLASDLKDRQRMLEEAVQAERDRIADELHDFIAHELTIIAMHARVLQQTRDEEIQRQSQEAIDGSARQALADIRRVLELTQATRGADDEPAGEEHGDAERRRLLPTITDVERELRAAGVQVELEGVYEVAPRMSRSMDMAMAQFLREAATNIIKHAGPASSVLVHLTTTDDDDIVMRVRNAVGGDGSLTLPRGGYGLERMRERANVLGGRFEAGPAGDDWLVEVQLPSR